MFTPSLSCSPTLRPRPPEGMTAGKAEDVSARHAFANGLHRDLDTVIASLLRSWSFGPVEIERRPEGDGELLDGWYSEIGYADVPFPSAADKPGVIGPILGSWPTKPVGNTVLGHCGCAASSADRGSWTRRSQASTPRTWAPGQDRLLGKALLCLPLQMPGGPPRCRKVPGRIRLVRSRAIHERPKGRACARQCSLTT